MNATHFHLLLNHAPVAGIAFGLFFLTVGLAKRSVTMRLSAMTLFVLSALLVLPVFITGGFAEEAVERLPGITESVIEAHEESADIAMIGTLLLGGIGGIALWSFAKHKTLSRGAGLSIGVFAIIVLLLIGRTAYLGGEIRHTEIGSNTAIAYD